MKMARYAFGLEGDAPLICFHKYGKMKAALFGAALVSVADIALIVDQRLRRGRDVATSL